MTKLILTLTALSTLAIVSPALAFAPSSFEFGDNGCTEKLRFCTTCTDNDYYSPKIDNAKNFVLLIEGDIRLNGGNIKRKGVYHFDNDYIKGEATMYRLKNISEKKQRQSPLITPMNDGRAMVCLVPKDKLGKYKKVR